MSSLVKVKANEKTVQVKAENNVLLDLNLKIKGNKLINRKNGAHPLNRFSLQETTRLAVS